MSPAPTLDRISGSVLGARRSAVMRAYPFGLLFASEEARAES